MGVEGRLDLYPRGYPYMGGLYPSPRVPQSGRLPNKKPPPRAVRGGSIGDHPPGELKNTKGSLFTVIPRTVGAKQKGYDFSSHMDADYPMTHSGHDMLAHTADLS